MKCDKFRTDMTHWMEISWEDPEPRIPAGMAQHAKECPSCAARLSAATALVRPAATQIRTPVGLRARIMDRIVADADGAGGAVVPIHYAPPARRPGPRLLWLAAAAAVLVLTTSLATVAVMRSRMGNQVDVHLVLEAPSAHSVSVVGDWNAWQAGTQLLADPDGDGRWEITIQVERGGEYRYQFVVDDENWISDPAAPLQVRDGFGGTNSVLNI